VSSILSRGSYLTDFTIHVIEVAVWALLFMICGEFQEFRAAYYHSAVNYSTSVW
jgi:hypothetical protein